MHVHVCGSGTYLAHLHANESHYDTYIHDYTSMSCKHVACRCDSCTSHCTQITKQLEEDAYVLPDSIPCMCLLIAFVSPLDRSLLQGTALFKGNPTSRYSYGTVTEYPIPF